MTLINNENQLLQLATNQTAYQRDLNKYLNQKTCQKKKRRKGKKSSCNSEKVGKFDELRHHIVSSF